MFDRNPNPDKWELYEEDFNSIVEYLMETEGEPEPLPLAS